jgi:isochorismate synthase EntC
MTEIAVAAIGAIGLVLVALIESGRRANNKRWEDNKADHNFVVDKIEQLGKSLGTSIDRVEDTALRTEEKLDQHINDHVTGKLKA